MNTANTQWLVVEEHGCAYSKKDNYLWYAPLDVGGNILVAEGRDVEQSPADFKAKHEDVCAELGFSPRQKIEYY